MILQQLIILLILLLCGIGSTIFLFWVLFKKDAPSYDEIKKTFVSE